MRKIVCVKYFRNTALEVSLLRYWFSLLLSSGFIDTIKRFEWKCVASNYSRPVVSITRVRVWLYNVLKALKAEKGSYQWKGGNKYCRHELNRIWEVETVIRYTCFCWLIYCETLVECWKFHFYCNKRWKSSLGIMIGSLWMQIKKKDYRKTIVQLSHWSVINNYGRTKS